MHMKKSRIISPYIIFAQFFGSGVKKAKERSAKITRKKAGKSVKSKEKSRMYRKSKDFLEKRDRR